MARHESAFQTDDPLLIDIAIIYQDVRDGILPDKKLLSAIQSAVSSYLSKPENTRRAIVDTTPTIIVTPVVTVQADYRLLNDGVDQIGGSYFDDNPEFVE